MSFNLIVPVAADHPEYSVQKPYWMDIHPSGNLMLFEAISGLNLEQFDAIYITMLKKHVVQYGFEEYVLRQFNLEGLGNKIKLVLLDSPTRNQPETVALTIEKENIIGAVVVKDADNHFECKLKPGNFLCTYPLDALTNVSPADKSYIDVDDNSFITNIVEKKIISRWFCTGAYGFEDSMLFVKYFKKYQKYKQLYISHLIYGMLLDNINFSPVSVINYLDWGNEKDWNNFKNLYRTLFIPYDLVLQKSIDVITAINRLFNTGKTTIVIVHRKDKLSLSEQKPEKLLKDIGLQYHHFINNMNLGNFALISKKNEILKAVNNL